MSDNIPFDIQLQIMKRLPVKSLIQFRSVSKTWKALIDSTEFITAYSLSHTQPQQPAGVYYDYDDGFYYFMTYRFSPVTIPLSSKICLYPRIIGSCQGLFCLYGYYQDQDPQCNPLHRVAYHKAVIWNPSIRKSIILNLSFSEYGYVLGFGVSPVTCDPIIVEIYSNYDVSKLVRVFKLSTGAWSNPTQHLPGHIGQVAWHQAVVDKFIYWFAYNRTYTIRLILSFDMTNDKFGVVDLPERLELINVHDNMSISKLQESLAVLEYRRDVCDVWVMEINGVQKSFIKRFSISTFTSAKTQIRRFNETGDIGIDPEEPALDLRSREDLYVNSFRETLILLDQQRSNDNFNLFW